MDSEQKNDLVREVAAQFPGSVLKTWGGSDGDPLRVVGFSLPSVLGEPEGMGIHVNYNEYKNTLNICGEYPKSKVNRGQEFYPRDCYPSVATPSMGCSAEKSPEKIAADIKRRFIPEYLVAFAACAARRDMFDAADNAKTELADSLAGILGGESHGNWQRYGSRDVHPVRDRVDFGAGSIETHTDSAEFKIRLPADKAKKLATFLANL